MFIKITRNNMKIKLIIKCSVFFVLLLLLIPSLSAIQIKSVENTVKNELMETNGTLDFRELKERINLVNISKHSILFIIVYAIYTLRILRTMILFELSTEVDWTGWQPVYEIIHPLLYQRAMWLGETAGMWLGLWYYISQFFNWGWEF